MRRRTRLEKLSRAFRFQEFMEKFVSRARETRHLPFSRSIGRSRIQLTIAFRLFSLSSRYALVNTSAYAFRTVQRIARSARAAKATRRNFSSKQRPRWRGYGRRGTRKKVSARRESERPSEKERGAVVSPSARLPASYLFTLR